MRRYLLYYVTYNLFQDYYYYLFSVNKPVIKQDIKTLCDTDKLCRSCQSHTKAPHRSGSSFG